MNARLDNVLEDALRLNAEERSAVTAALIDSLETAEEDSVVATWRLELLRRREELRTGALQATPWTDVRKRMNRL